MIKSKKMASLTGEEQCKVLVVKREGMRTLERGRSRWDIKMDIVNKQNGRKRAQLIWIRIGDYGWAVVNMVMNLRDPKNS
jgi:hypothetical protein